MTSPEQVGSAAMTSTGQGRSAVMTDSYDIEELKRTVREKSRHDLKVIYLEQTGSTNVWAGEYIKRQCSKDGDILVLANDQTAGRGRLGHSWKAQPGEGISMSLIIDPRMEMSRIPQITLTAGIAVRRALKEVADLDSGIKWPNDIMVKSAEGSEYRKLCGILCSMSCDMAICGIGINVHNAGFPDELADRASSVDLCTGGYADRTRLAGAVTAQLLILLDILRDEGWGALKAEYDRYCINREGRILLTDHVNPSGKKTGTAYGTDSEGRLRVVWDDGKAAILDAGEIDMLY